MPDFPVAATPVDRVSSSVTFLDYAGRKADVGLEHPAAGGATIEAWQSAVADMSNAAAIKKSTSSSEEISPAAAATFDEAYASVTDKMVLVFQDAGLNKRSMAIPAPDASFFGSDGQTVIAPDSAAAAGSAAELLDNAVTAIETVLGGTWSYLGGYLATRSRGSVGLTARPPIAEPEAGDAPGDEPGV